MSRAIKTYMKNPGGVNPYPVKLTIAECNTLAMQARRYGYFDRGYDAGTNAEKLEVRCPLCAETVTAYWARWGKVTKLRTLDRAVIAHLQDDCSVPS